MDGKTGNLSNVLMGFAYAALIGVVAMVALAMLGDFDWPAAVFLGGLLAVVLGALIGVVVGKPLPHVAHVAPENTISAPAIAAPAMAAPVMSAPVMNAAQPAMAKPAAVAKVAAPAKPPAAAKKPAAAKAPAATKKPAAPVALVVVDDAAVAAAGAGTKPKALSGPRGGKADNLKDIEGIGPVLEKLCHDMGIFHFDQIAGWGPGEVAWMNGNLKGFKGRVGRDKWVAQARLIGSVGMEEFKRRAATNNY